MKTIYIYTDGSHLDKQNNGRLGCGGVMVDRSGPGMGKLLGSFSVELEPGRMLSEFGAQKCSNPSAELVGVLEALRRLKIPSGTDMVIFKEDYNGVKFWMEGKWRIKEPYIKEIRRQIDLEIKKQGLEGRLLFQWVKGHQSQSLLDPDAYWNNYVDKLAKGESE